MMDDVTILPFLTLPYQPQMDEATICQLLYLSHLPALLMMTHLERFVLITLLKHIDAQPTNGPLKNSPTRRYLYSTSDASGNDE